MSVRFWEVEEIIMSLRTLELDVRDLIMDALTLELDIELDMALEGTPNMNTMTDKTGTGIGWVE